MPVQPRTPKQTSTRALFTIGSSSWRTLTTAQQTAWNDYAAQISRSDSLGSTYQPTGAELYTGAVVSTAAIAVTDPPALLPTYFLQVTGILYTDPSPGPEAFTATVAHISPDNLFTIETSGPVSAGLTSAAAIRRWRSLPASPLNLAAQLFTFTASPVAFLTEYKYLFPSPTSGQAIWFRFREIFYDPGTSTGIVNKQRQTLRYDVP